ncbi:hypothetical protein MFMK1_001967 [Metallumcola ferriviriculae]|uniref:Transcription regulator AsnC/Lrp ligand binding domain-containing protein n=1 Tax=Metallumcola ferriviriculae TaxID=3039180 RepID=A0AAU0UP46_9FIRM|nr:hypothetical protein MFMK1_001967 [Desulfitibacteraceae bacterium MK1]
MGARAYLLVNVMDGVKHREFIKILQELENTLEVDFVDPVVGDYDLVIMIEAPVTVQCVAQKIAEQPWVANLSVLKMTSLLERHKPIKSLSISVTEGQ